MKIKMDETQKICNDDKSDLVIFCELWHLHTIKHLPKPKEHYIRETVKHNVYK